MKVLVPDDLMSYERRILRTELARFSFEVIFAGSDPQAKAVLTGGEPLNAVFFQNNPRLEFAVRFARGRHELRSEEVAVEAAGVCHGNVAGSSSESTAEHVVMLMLCLLRQFYPAHAGMLAGSWVQRETLEAEIRDLSETTVGLVGLGRVGLAVLRLLRPFGPRILYSKPHRMTPQEEQDFGIAWAPLDELLIQSDVISLQARTTGLPSPILTEARLQLVRDGAVLVNTGDGRHIDLAALESRLLAGSLSAALDVYPQEPYILKSHLAHTRALLATPHVAGRSRATAQKLFAGAVRELDRLLTSRGRPTGMNTIKGSRMGPVLREALKLVDGEKCLLGSRVDLPASVLPQLPGLGVALRQLGARVVQVRQGPIQISSASESHDVSLELGASERDTQAFSIGDIPVLQRVIERWRLDYQLWNCLLPKGAVGSLPGRTLLLDGYGPRGSRIAMRARQLGLEVRVFETRPRCRLEAAYDGFQSYEGVAPSADLVVRTGESNCAVDKVFAPLSSIPAGIADETATAVLIALSRLSPARGAHQNRREHLVGDCERLLTEALVACRCRV